MTKQEKPRNTKSSKPKSSPSKTYKASATPFRSPGKNPTPYRIDSSQSRPAPSRDDARDEAPSRPKSRKMAVVSYKPKARPNAEPPATPQTTTWPPAAKASPARATRPTSARPAASRPASRPAQTTPRPTTPKLDIPTPYAVVTRRASETLRQGHLWVYSSELMALELGSGEPPRLIPVVDGRGILLGTAHLSPASQLPLRIVARELVTEPAWLALLADRLRAAIARRRPMLDALTDACRLVFSEADQLPGLIIDKYAGIVIVQLLTRGLDTDQVRATVAQVLQQELLTANAQLTVWERADARIRELEGISAPQLTPLFTTQPDAPQTSTTFHLNGLSFLFDANSGQKTGAFLDQRENYRAAAQWARSLQLTGKALDVCTYQGGFALHLAQVCAQVTGVDSSRASLEVAERNLEANRALLSGSVDWVEADAFQLLRNWSEAEHDWDVIVVDPPAFAKSKRAIEGALRGYKELNLRALKMLRPGGLLVTCSCSHHVSLAELESVVAAAAVDADRRVTLLERRGAAHDHPVLLNLPESEYLKCLILQVD